MKILLAIAIVGVLFIVCDSLVKSDDREIDDIAQVKWLQEHKNKKQTE